jgi:hypothetical protein
VLSVEVVSEEVEGCCCSSGCMPVCRDNGGSVKLGVAEGELEVPVSAVV